MSSPIVTRFAPSPTGFMHIGSIRTALFAYLYARKHEGTFILRIEDTDKEREVAGSIEHIIESLTWLNLTWDYGPDKEGPFGSCIQSQRLDTYRTFALKLVERGLAYPDPYTKEEVESFRVQAQQEERPFLFRNHRPETFAAWDGTTPLRLKVPQIKKYTWYDEVRGELSAGEEMLDDIIIVKADGFPTYNFAHIIDDHLMGVTHVMRGDEFISSTPKFLSIYDALEIPYPKFVSLPPILREDRTKKLGKRDGAKDILTYRQEGYLPETMVNFLALVGWNPGTDQELFTLRDLIEHFSIEGIQKGGAVFNEEKLKWMNREYLQKMDVEAQLTYVQDALPDSVTSLPDYSPERLSKLLPEIMQRAHTKAEINQAAREGEYDYLFSDPDVAIELVQWKNDTSVHDALPRLKEAQNLLNVADFSSPEQIKQALWVYAEKVGKGELLWPLRVSLTGRERSIDPFTVLYIIGKESGLRRLQAACDKIEK